MSAPSTMVIRDVRPFWFREKMGDGGPGSLRSEKGNLSSRIPTKVRDPVDTPVFPESSHGEGLTNRRDPRPSLTTVSLRTVHEQKTSSLTVIRTVSPGPGVPSDHDNTGKLVPRLRIPYYRVLVFDRSPVRW